jgi:hypothetical protein
VRFGCLVLASAAIFAAACCPPPDPEEPSSLPPPPKTTTARTMPPAIVSRFEPPVKNPPRPPAKPPEREMLKEPPLVPPARPKTELQPRRETLEPRHETPPTRPAPTERLPDDVVLALLETGKAAFVRCFKKAIASDPTVISFKVRVRVEVDEDGAITAASADTTDTALAACLTRSTGWLRFPATGKRVRVELPLFYRGQ